MFLLRLLTFLLLFRVPEDIIRSLDEVIHSLAVSSVFLSHYLGYIITHIIYEFVIVYSYYMYRYSTHDYDCYSTHQHDVADNKLTEPAAVKC